MNPYSPTSSWAFRGTCEHDWKWYCIGSCLNTWKPVEFVKVQNGIPNRIPSYKMKILLPHLVNHGLDKAQVIWLTVPLPRFPWWFSGSNGCKFLQSCPSFIWGNFPTTFLLDGRKGLWVGPQPGGFHFCSQGFCEGHPLKPQLLSLDFWVNFWDEKLEQHFIGKDNPIMRYFDHCIEITFVKVRFSV